MSASIPGEEFEAFYEPFTAEARRRFGHLWKSLRPDEVSQEYAERYGLNYECALKIFGPQLQKIQLLINRLPVPVRIVGHSAFLSLIFEEENHVAVFESNQWAIAQGGARVTRT